MFTLRYISSSCFPFSAFLCLLSPRFFSLPPLSLFLLCCQEEMHLLDFHYSNLEFACGATLDKVFRPYQNRENTCTLQHVCVVCTCTSIIIIWFDIKSPSVLSTHSCHTYNSVKWCRLLPPPPSPSRFLPSTGTTTTTLTSSPVATPSCPEATALSSPGWPRVSRSTYARP